MFQFFDWHVDSDRLFLIWIYNSIYIIKEWERGVVLRLGRLLPIAKGAGITWCSGPLRPCIASTCAWKRSTFRPGHHHPRQCLRKSKRRLLFPRG